MRQVYIVRGSEDGILGAFSTIKRAFDVAHRYVDHPQGKSEFFDGNKWKRANYRNVCKQMKLDQWVTIESAEKGTYGQTYTLTSDIEIFTINEER